jgi:hypothetical protein
MLDKNVYFLGYLFFPTTVKTELHYVHNEITQFRM